MLCAFKKNDEILSERFGILMGGIGYGGWRVEDSIYIGVGDSGFCGIDMHKCLV